ncbi:MAG: Lrp/AsnC family transcriptional regulator [Candidatus Micrarchaeota archaeon]
MKWEIDAKDRAILYHLDDDARQPVSKLSKKVRLNREVVRYRVDRMLKDGVIKKFLSYLTVPETGYIPLSFFLRFQNTSHNDEEKVVKYLKDKKSVVWLASMDGRFNLGCVICAQKMSEVADFVGEFKDEYGEYLSDFQMANIISMWRFPRTYLLGEDIDPPKLEKRIVVKEAKIDSVDRSILAALGEDGRMKAVEIAQRAGISADAVADRINKLKKKGIIERFTVILNNLAIKRRFFRSFVTFHNQKKIERKFLNYCNEHPNAIQVKRMLGPWEYEVDLEVKDETELREIHAKFKKYFGEYVRSTSFASIYNIHKYDMGGFLK